MVPDEISLVKPKNRPEQSKTKPVKAILLNEYGDPSKLEFAETENPNPKKGEVLVKVHACSINDWDWSIIRGKPFYIRLLCGLLKPKIRIPGAEISGTISAVGDDVNTLHIGDAVYGDISECGFGGLAEYVAVHHSALSRMPGGMSFEEAAALPHAAMLALQGLQDYTNLTTDQSVLVNGAGGGVGTLGLQIAHYFGLTTITGVDHTDKVSPLQNLGFTDVIDYTQEDFTKSTSKYDLILDTKTNRSPFAYLKALKTGGAYVTVGGSTLRLIQTLIASLFINRFSKKRIHIVALKPNRDLAKINQLFQAGKLKPVIDSVSEYDQTPAAIQRFGEAKHFGKVIVSIRGTDVAEHNG